MENGPLLGVTVEDDLLKGSPIMPDSGSCENNYSGLETDARQKEHSKICKQAEQIAELSETLEEKPWKSRNVNSRKSLAWDSAFFTSEGILDAEELAIVNGTFSKAEACTLPSIEEDIKRSTESTSILDTDNWDLESLEVDLFQDLRASIQNSLGKCDKAPYDRTGEASKKIENTSRNKMKPNNNLGRHVPTKQRAGDTSKQALIRVKMDTSGTRASTSSTKPLGLVSRPSVLPSMPWKKASVSGSIQTKSNTEKSLSVTVGKSVPQKSKFRKLSTDIQGSRVGNSGSLLQGPASSGRGNHSKGFSQSSLVKDASGTGASKSLIKPPGFLPKSTALPGKKAPVSGSIQTKSKNTRFLSGNADKGPSAEFLKIGANSSSMTRRPVTSLKSTLDTNFSDESTSVSSSSDRSHRSLLESPRNMSTRNSHYPSEPTTKTIIRTSRSKIGLKSADSSPTCIYPMINRSSSVSSNSSLGSVVTVSSSSSVAKPKRLLTDLRGSRTGNSGNVVHSGGSGNRTESLGYCSTGEKCSNSSGLRLPSPKMGFFDVSRPQNNPPKNSTGNTNAIGPKKLKPNHSLRSAAQKGTMNSKLRHTPEKCTSSIQGSKSPTLVSLDPLSKLAELHYTPTITRDHLLCSRVKMDMSPITREAGHAIPEKGGCVLNEYSQLSNFNEEKTSYSNSKYMTSTRDRKEFKSVPQAIEKENLRSTDNISGLVELLGQRVSYLSLSEMKGSDTGELEPSPQISIPIVPGD